MDLFNRIKKLIAQRQIIKSMAIKNLKAKYVGSTLGILWAIINPLLIMFVVTFVFTKIMNTETKNFPLFMLSALLPWFFFANSISEATTSMRDNVNVLSQFVMTREIIPISIVLANFINFLFGFAVMLPIFIIFNAGVLRHLFLLPLAMILHFAFVLGVSLSFSVINVYFRDLSQLLNVGLMFLFWLTPIFYSLDMIPEAYHMVVFINPAVCYAVIYRALLYHGSSAGIFIWLLSFGFALVSIISGYFLFIKKETEILKHI